MDTFELHIFKQKDSYWINVVNSGKSNTTIPGWDDTTNNFETIERCVYFCDDFLNGYKSLIKYDYFL